MDAPIPASHCWPTAQSRIKCQPYNCSCICDERPPDDLGPCSGRRFDGRDPSALATPPRCGCPWTEGGSAPPSAGGASWPGWGKEVRRCPLRGHPQRGVLTAFPTSRSARLPPNPLAGEPVRACVATQSPRRSERPNRLEVPPVDASESRRGATPVPPPIAFSRISDRSGVNSSSGVVKCMTEGLADGIAVPLCTPRPALSDTGYRWISRSAWSRHGPGSSRPLAQADCIFRYLTAELHWRLRIAGAQRWPSITRRCSQRP